MNVQEMIGHAKMCVRMKLNLDLKNLERRGDSMPPETKQSVVNRIDRGQQTLAWLQRLTKEATGYPLPETPPDWPRSQTEAEHDAEVQRGLDQDPYA